MEFLDGDRISSFIKNTDRIWEGIVITRSDGIKTVFNEQTNRWKKLGDLEYVKKLNENFSTVSTSGIKSTFNSSENKELKYDDLKKNLVNDIVGNDPKKAVENAEKVVANKSAISAGGQALYSQANSILKNKSEAPSTEEEASEDFNNEMKNIAAKAKAAETGNPEDGIKKIKQMSGIQESLSQIHPFLHKFFEKKEDGDTKDDNPKQNSKKFIKYENEDYLDIPEEVASCVIADIISLLQKNEDNIEDRIKSSYEISESDMEDFMIKAMELYLDDLDGVENKVIDDVTMDEVEKSFEKTIDNYEGDESGLLDHLVDVYEIDPGMAEQIFIENDSKLTETIFSFVQIVKNRIREKLIK